MRKALFAGISAFALAVAFGSTASANPFEDATKSFDISSTQNGNSDQGGNNNQNNIQSNAPYNAQNGATNSVITKSTADQNITQFNSLLGVHINVSGGAGGAGGKM